MDQPILIYGFLVAMGLFAAGWFLFVVPSERRYHERKLALVQKRIVELEARRKQEADLDEERDEARDRVADDPAVLETERLSLREMTLDDAAFLLHILNDADFLQYVGDRGIRSIDDARAYLLRGPIDSYRRHGYGMYLAVLKADESVVGLCGLVRRQELPEPDIGFAFLPQYRSRGYASEATAAILEYGSGVLALPRILAIATPDNLPSNRVLQKAGMRLDGAVRLPGDDDDLNLYVYEA
jgi:RimJ/RimL family protein N-acetyltransferase